MSEKVERICEICGKLFYVFPSNIKRGQGKYCSNKCKGKAYTSTGNMNWKPKIDRVCDYCGEHFETYPCRMAQGKGKYCSIKCWNLAARTIDRNRKCKVCNKELMPYQKKYCSVECYGKGNSGSANHNYGGGEIEKACPVCGTHYWVKRATIEKGQGIVCSRRCWGKIMTKTMRGKTYSRARGGTRDDLGFYVRSGWEANWARYLKWLETNGDILAWEYEPETFEFVGIKRGSRFYTPDFKVYNLDGGIEYHEVKGYMDKQSATKLKRMAKYYPDIKLIVIDKDAYDAVKNWSSLIEYWE